MNYIASEPGRTSVLIVLAQQAGTPIDEQQLASNASILHQNLTGQAIEMAVALKHVRDLGQQGYLERAEDGLRWKMSPLGTLVSQQWIPAHVEPPGQDALDESEVRGWRDRVLGQMEQDVELARQAGFPQEEWLLTQNQRMTELVVLNRVLGEQKMPSWFEELQQQQGQA